MCGIALAYNPQGTIETSVLTSMLNVARHRGPNDQGLFVSDNGICGLGMNRLSIIDLETGQQPIENEDGNLVLVCNGEIYNYKAIRKRLEKQGHAFKTGSDVEVILHLYEEKGISGFEELDGMFAFAIYNKNTQELIVGRDRFGIKPVYYTRNKRAFYFASEPKSILEALDQRKVKSRVLFEYLIWGFAISGESIWTDIKNLSAGSCMKLNGNSFEIVNFLPVSDDKPYESRDEARKDLRQALIESIESQLMSDVPLGVFLSGGIDSTIMVGVVSKILGRDVKTFSIDFEGAAYSEIDKINSVVKQFGTEQRTFLADKTAFTMLDDLIMSCDEPFGDAAALPTLYLSKKTVEHVTVALSGDGSDEFMFGYGYHHNCSADRPFLKNPWFHGLAKGIKLSNPKYYSLLARTAPAHFFPTSVYYHLREELFTDNDTPQPSFDSFADFERSSYLPNDILLKTDRTTMFHSLEARVPFLGNEVVNVAKRISKSFQVSNGQGKVLLKEAFSDILSNDILHQKKHGFTTPVGTWVLQDYDKSTFRSLVYNAGFVKLLDAKWLDRIIEEHFSKKFDHGKFIYRLLVVARWGQLYSPTYQVN